MRYLIIIPCYNEALNIVKVFEDLTEFIGATRLNADILAINDSSTDNTEQVLRENKICFLSLPFNLGYSGALQTGFKYAIAHNFDFVIQFDGDGQHIPTEIQKLLNAQAENDADIVIGSRFILNSGYKHGLLRSLGTKIFTLLINMICGEKITDPTSGFQILKREVFSRYAKMGAYPRYPDANLVIQMILEGFKVREVPVKMQLRIFGVSMHAGFWNPLFYMVHMFYSIFMIIIQYGASMFHHQKSIK
ncbi:MAG: glycosyltransferase family 2 protein [Saprospiraceae bacterium]|nr:glycosyltransferase family 2 protein [Saprospiraceae bacterium]